MTEHLTAKPTVLDAILHHWLPVHVNRWLTEHGEDYISEAIREGTRPTWETVIEQALDAYPIAMTEQELDALPRLVPEELRYQIRYRLHRLAVEPAGRR